MGGGVLQVVAAAVECGWPGLRGCSLRTRRCSSYAIRVSSRHAVASKVDSSHMAGLRRNQAAVEQQRQHYILLLQALPAPC
jgi:hypothetical protein